MKFKADEIASVHPDRKLSTTNPRSTSARSAACWRSATALRASTACPASWPAKWSSSPTASIGLAFNLEENSVGVIILGDYLQINEGDEVKSTGRLLSVPVGDAVIGRVVDPLGNPLDGKGPIVTTERRAGRDRSPPAWPQRQPVREPLQTGIKAIDAMTPIGRGQRELIIGDRKTGKTAIGIDTIINQKNSGVKCFYVAVGQKESTVAGVIEALAQARRDGLHDRDRRRRQRSGPAAIHRSLCRHGDGRVLHVQRRARPDRLRRPVEAGRGLSAVVAVDAPPAGTRGLSGRRVLLPTAGCWSARPS